MDPLNWKRLPLLAIAGIAIGFGAAWLVERTDWHPLVAPAISILAAGGLAAALRNAELLNFLLEDGLFVYCTYIGMSIIRAVGIHNYIATHVGDLRTPQLLDGVNIVVLAAGIAYTLMVVFIVALPSWALAQRSSRRELKRDAEFWSFVEEQNRSR